jgi:hypothetical protein
LNHSLIQVDLALKTKDIELAEIEAKLRDKGKL